MALNIIRGKTAAAIRGVIYGTEGIGKSTIASKIPDSLIIDTEDGSGQIDTARVVCLDWRAIEHAVKELIADTQGFRAVIIDTADWLEKALIEHMLKQAGKKSIEDYGFGKGYTILAEHVVRFLALCDQLVAKGVHVVFVAHAKVVRTSPPDQTDGFDRYELKLTKQVAPLFKEWADMVLFCQFRIQIIEGTDGRLKAQGGKERIMHAVHSAAWDAKNRYGLPEEMPMDFAKIAHLFTAAAPRSTAQLKAATVEAAIVADPTPTPTKAKKVAAEKTEPLPTLATSEQVDKLSEHHRDNPNLYQLIEKSMFRAGVIEFAELTSEQANELLTRIESLSIPQVNASPLPQEKAEPALPPKVKEWINTGENEGTLNTYLIHIKWIAAGQSWRDVDPDNLDIMCDKFEKVKHAAENHRALNARKAA